MKTIKQHLGEISRIEALSSKLNGYNTGKLVELNGMVDRSRSKASRIRAKSQSSNTVTVVTENLRCGGGKKRVVN